MKRTNIYIVISVLIYISGFYLLKPLSGYIYTKDSESAPNVYGTQPLPADPISAFMLNFSHEIKGEPISLEGVEHLIIKGNPKSKHSSVTIKSNNSSVVEVTNYYYYQDIPYKKENKTLTIDIEGLNNPFININLDNTSIKKLTFNQLKGYIKFNIADSSRTLIDQLFVENESDLKITNEYRETPASIPTLNLRLTDKSILEVDKVSVGNLNSLITNSRLEVSNSGRIDSVNINLEGLSHVRGAKMQVGKNISFLNVTGDLAYYNTH